MKNSKQVQALSSPAGSHVIFAYVLLDGRPVGWLKAYNPDAHKGRGQADFTDDQNKALRFEKDAAFRCLMLASTVRPLRSDGHPNRPLRAFHIAIHPFGEQPI